MINNKFCMIQLYKIIVAIKRKVAPTITLHDKKRACIMDSEMGVHSHLN